MSRVMCHVSHVTCKIMIETVKLHSEDCDCEQFKSVKGKNDLK